MQQKLCLIILDGWGHGVDNPKINAIKAAKTPFVDSLYSNYPNCELLTCGEHVGLPEGQMGNSEVGHLNIGAGRIVYQQLAKINNSFKTGEIASNKTLTNAIECAKTNKKNIHLIGLVSDGGVHSHINHLKGLLTVLASNKLENVFVHAFTDGRDCDPKSGVGFISELQEHISTTTGMLATVIGRYYAMDRDKKWDRIKLSYDAMVLAKGEKTADFKSEILNQYKNDVTDEFLPALVSDQYKESDGIKDGDVVINFNFRTDRGRQITQVLTQTNFPDYNMHCFDLQYITMTEYDSTYRNVKVLFETINLTHTLGEVMELNHKSQLRIAETEKYPHVTFFFSGGQEKPFIGEVRIMCQSPKVATYDLAPEMSAQCLADKTILAMQSNFDLIVLNFANADMVGHTGVFEAVVKAVETVDSCAQQVVNAGIENGYICLVTADHGNADFEVNEDGSPNTAHSLNPVPFFLISENSNIELRDGKLADIAPTILTLMKLDIPKEMTGEVLIK